MSKLKLTIISLLILLTATHTALAISFNPDFLLSDEEMFDYQSMNWSDIQAFLETKEGILKDLIIENYEGRRLAASAIIYLAAKEYKINPKVLLAKLQHEGSLITNANPKDRELTWATGWHVCDSCYIGNVAQKIKI